MVSMLPSHCLFLKVLLNCGGQEIIEAEVVCSNELYYKGQRPGLVCKGIQIQIRMHFFI